MSILQKFKSDISNIELPKKFTFPFYYTPHKLVEIAAGELQDYLLNQNDFDYNFGVRDDQKGTPHGKMFGVLVVKQKDGELKYLKAFSGKLGTLDTPKGFVPPVFDIYAKDSFYPEGEKQVDELTLKVQALENDPVLYKLKDEYDQLKNEINQKLENEKESMRIAKAKRKEKRIYGERELNPNELNNLKKQLADESIYRQNNYKKMKAELDEQLSFSEKRYKKKLDELINLKDLRKKTSSSLQKRIFESYQFLNKNGDTKNLTDIFPLFEDNKPPAGSGDCTAPKLLQYAFANNLAPIAMGEFWWGTSPKDEIRQHKVFYPACNSRCKPILAHMLEGVEMDENILVKQPEIKKDLPIVYEDDWLLVINKPPDFLSVPGKNVSESVYSRMKELLGDDKGPLLVHRLDMSTSGLLVVAKNKDIHKHLQSQFINREVKKKYVALLDGIPKESSGIIALPLRVDLDDRPRQLVCYDYGKKAITKWELDKIIEGRAKVKLYPLTGRTHQLRVHMAHNSGLNLPIVGDDLYGTRDKRLFLHAEYLRFFHPHLKKVIEIEKKADF